MKPYHRRRLNRTEQQRPCWSLTNANSRRQDTDKKIVCRVAFQLHTLSTDNCYWCSINNVSGVHNYVWNFVFKDVLKLFKEGLVRIDCDSVFHNFETEFEKEWSSNAVRDLGTERSPFSDDLKNEYGLSRLDIYAGAKLFSALCVNTAILYISV